MDNLKIPNHVGVIVDGNGRWAKERGLTRSDGHKAGVENLEHLFTYMINRGVNVISAYIFSTENFKRSEAEVKYLMDMIVKKFKLYSKKYNKENIKIIFSGRKDGLRSDVIEVINALEDKTKNNTKGIINFCLNYGGHAEIIDATKKIYNDINNGVLSINELNDEIYAKYLYQDLPPIDLLIRTSGENRISNFMLWQISYAEFYFPKTYFPDFDEKEFEIALLEYNKRDRRFGGIKYENKNN